MPTIEITDAHRDRIETLREELTAAHAGPYASVDTEDALTYLFDLADAVDDPDRLADPEALGGADGSEPPFDRDRARERLESRPRRHGDPDAAEELDLYEIAAAFDVSGRSDMTKAELVDAILDAAASLSTDPFSHVDVDLGEGGADGDRDESGAGIEASEPADGETSTGDEETATGDEDGGAGQLDAMMSLLDTHADKWREADGDARYEVDLPDGGVETARTKDDVRALLFRNY
ncbi:hypothetical protein U4E84_12720 [Halorubrum sp. AD140]|uniref:Rho termination factor N-terminal domain-containing protein n=1 Tax=Halorubrum sp. AD140 TaxID=3050073 RepID=UPI002ACC8E08|nr:Rho termination factor N-terminal domain-containing protein [Halorubrum sp. AD140]MDZ5812205.1 hypothetical protein [Halorubrum sp. AD140]